jgi:hypothetical protein
MANFDTGVKRYIKTYAVVEVFFPVDWKDNPEVACKHCPFFVRSSQRCGLTQSVVNFPDKYVGECCPLEEVRYDVC